MSLSSLPCINRISKPPTISSSCFSVSNFMIFIFISLFACIYYKNKYIKVYIKIILDKYALCSLILLIITIKFNIKNSKRYKSWFYIQLFKLAKNYVIIGSNEYSI